MPSRPRLAAHWKIVIGLVLGIAAGVAIDRFWTPATWSALGVQDPASFMARKPRELFATGAPADANAHASPFAQLIRVLVNLNALVGQFFFRALRFIAVPIVLCSLTVGVASLGDLRRLGRIGAKTLTVFVVTTALSIAMGLALTNAVRPGAFVDPDSRQRLLQQYQVRVGESVSRTADIPSLWQQALDLVPPNPFQALAQAEMLQTIVFSIALGAGLTLIPRAKADPVVRFFDACTDAIVMLVNLVMKIAPVAVFSLVAPAIVAAGLDVLGAVAVYSLVLASGLALVLFLLYPLMLRSLARYPASRFFRGLSPAILTAFSSSSSNATLPVTLTCTRERLGVSERVAAFVCPLGATINMAGTAMYQGVATVFIAQLYAIDLSITQQATVVLTATLAAIGTPGIPGAGVVMLVIVMQGVGVPPEGIAVILGVDRLLDMCRTVVNIAGDSATAVVVAYSEGELDVRPAPSAIP